jgi:hypothetical protein
MIKRLFFVVALLVPGLAYGGNPSADLSVQIVPAAPPIPAGAQAAGFTTLAANYNFSEPLYANNANWLGCWPQDGNPHQFYQQGNGPGFPTAPPPCSNIAQIFDSQAANGAGANVMNFHWRGSDFHRTNTGACGNHADQLNDQFQSIQTANSATTQITDFPPNIYVEVRYRLAQAYPPVDSGYCFTDASAFYMWPSNTNNGWSNSIERDIGDFGQDNSIVSNVINWINSAGTWPMCANGPCVSGNLNVYHTWGRRITSDGNRIESCQYIDGQFQVCRDEAANATQLILRWLLIFQNGNVSIDRDAYVEYIHVWSCANWQTTQCDGLVLAGAP